MFRTFLFILFLCGLTAVSVVFEYKASAAAYTCQPQCVCQPASPPPCQPMLCLPSVQPPDCPRPDCEGVQHPLLRRSCAQMWREHLMKTGVRSPQLPCFVFRDDPLDAVARVSTHNILRAIGR